MVGMEVRIIEDFERRGLERLVDLWWEPELLAVRSGCPEVSRAFARRESSIGVIDWAMADSWRRAGPRRRAARCNIKESRPLSCGWWSDGGGDGGRDDGGATNRRLRRASRRAKDELHTHDALLDFCSGFPTGSTPHADHHRRQAGLAVLLLRQASASTSAAVAADRTPLTHQLIGHWAMTADGQLHVIRTPLPSI